MDLYRLTNNIKLKDMIGYMQVVMLLEWLI